ncbi:hypothetical protein MNV49_005952 [Pseudohyphozyma bogoriensis]|nr:hypothetical protein MNV49_005952 [Pseudohyphozyma bogoriensis]
MVTTTQPKFVQFNQGFSQLGGRQVFEEGEEGWRPTFTSLPVISFKNINGTLEERQALAKEVGAAFRDVGFLYAKDCPGVTPELVEETFEVIRQFFKIPQEQKQAVSWDHSTACVGYEGFREARDLIGDKTQDDMRESYIVCDDMLDKEQNYPGVPPAGTLQLNQWPAEFPQIRTQMYKYFNQICPLARSLIKILAMALNLPEDVFDEYLDWPIWSLRSHHYLPRPPTEDIPGFGAHDDYSFFTLLAQEPGSGPALQVLNLNGKWISAPPIPEATFVINCGNFLERMTNGEFVSTIHRVSNHTGQERYSLPFFFSPNPDRTIAPLAPLVPEGEEPKYGSLDVGQNYAQRMFQTRRYHPSSVLLKKKGIPAHEYVYDYLRYGVKDE